MLLLCFQLVFFRGYLQDSLATSADIKRPHVGCVLLNPVKLLISGIMVRSALLSSFVLSAAALAFGSPLEKRAEGLTVELSTPSSLIPSIEGLTVVATVTNTGTEPVRLLKYGTVLDDKLPTKSFVVSKDGEAVPFTGVKVYILHLSLWRRDDHTHLLLII
jgi:hypothetical protein